MRTCRLKKQLSAESSRWLISLFYFPRAAKFVSRLRTQFRMAAASTNSGQGSTKITPEVLQEMLQYYNLSRRDFINAYNIQPLVYIPELPYSAKATFVIMYVVIFVLALAGNSLVIYIIVKKRTIQTATDIFICSLAVSDLLITFFCIPFTLLQNISSEWFGGELWTYIKPPTF